LQTIYRVCITQKKKAPEGAFLLFSVTRYNYLVEVTPLGELLQKMRRLHLWFLLDLQSSPTVLPLSLSHHVETGRAH